MALIWIELISDEYFYIRNYDRQSSKRSVASVALSEIGKNRADGIMKTNTRSLEDSDLKVEDLIQLRCKVPEKLLEEVFSV